MARDSKILTVSYGAFSCTLEGFEDPFSAMKAVAEYFRDLTAEDRSFGAVSKPVDEAFLESLAARDAEAAAQQDDLSPEAEAAAEAVEPLAEAAPPLAEAEPTPPEGVTARLARLRQMLSVPPVAPPVAAEPVEAAAEPEEAPARDELVGKLDALLQEPEGDAAPAPAGMPDSVSGPDDSNAAAISEAVGFDAGVEADDAAQSRDGKGLDLATDFVLPEPDLSAPMWNDADDTAEADAPAGTWQDDSVEAEAAMASGDAALRNIFPEEGEDVPATDQPAVADDVAAIPDADLPEDRPETAETLAQALRDDPLPEAVASPSDAEEAVRRQPSAKSSKSKRVTSRIVRIHPDDEDDLPAAAQAPTQPSAAPAEAEDEVSRLMRHADDEMSDVDNRRRLDSLAHLKAAVAATEAERAVTGDTIHAADPHMDRYRDDLAHVVQPDDPETEDDDRDVAQAPATPDAPAGTARPGNFTPPPLVLVSEQRIDRAPAEAAPAAQQPPLAPLRTGRLSGMIGAGAAVASPVSPDAKLVLPKPSHGGPVDQEDEDDAEEDLTELDEAGLASFARNLGVTSMAEMLEAAAAYATSVEKRSQFTRPQLMRRLLASAGGRPVSREDGLRSFGMLLRTGRIEKVGRGHYRLSPGSPYLAEARRLS